MSTTFIRLSKKLITAQATLVEANLFSAYICIVVSLWPRPRTKYFGNLRSSSPCLSLALLGAYNGRAIVEVGAAINLRSTPEPITGTN